MNQIEHLQPLLTTVCAAQFGVLARPLLAALIVLADQEGLATHATFTGQLEALTGTSTVHMVLLIPRKKTANLCTSADVEEGRILNTNEGLLKVKFLGCIVRQSIGEKEKKEKKLKACKINQAGSS